MVNLAQLLVERFMVTNPNIPVAVTGGGTGVGIAALINGNSDISLCSRDMHKDEMDIAKKKGVNPNEITVAIDGVAIIVSNKNKLTQIDEDQLSDIYSGKIKNWSQLGGPNEKIVVLSRDRNSGTHTFFLEHVVKHKDKKNKNEFAKDVLMMPSTQAIVEEVISNSQAIGYIGLGYLTPKVKTLAVAKNRQSKYIFPTIDNTTSKLYPISRPLFFYTNGLPRGLVADFIEFTTSEVGQKIVIETGFVPLVKK